MIDITPNNPNNLRTSGTVQQQSPGTPEMMSTDDNLRAPSPTHSAFGRDFNDQEGYLIVLFN